VQRGKGCVNLLGFWKPRGIATVTVHCIKHN